MKPFLNNYKLNAKNNMSKSSKGKFFQSDDNFSSTFSSTIPISVHVNYFMNFKAY